MFFFTYLRRELRRRMRQSIFIALGLALGIGLVITVIGASNGVKSAQAKVLADLYGVGTDLTVTTTPAAPKPGSGQGVRIGIGPGGGQECTNGKCTPLKGGDVIDNMSPADYGTLATSKVAAVAALHDVKSAVGGLLLSENRLVIPSGQANIQPPTSTSVDGIDPAHETAGPIGNATLSSGRNLKGTDTYAALVDANYAKSHSLKLGGTVTLANKKFTIVGIVTQPESASPPEVYIPLATAQALSTNGPDGSSLKGYVDTIYVTAASASDISTVQKEIQQLLPGATVTSSASLASQITGSLSSTAKLANELGKWLSILVLIAAFAVASLLTLAAVARRTPEFGTLKALGWRGSRIVSQLLGESVLTGIAGGVIGIGLGFAGVAIIDAVAPKLSATIGSPNANGPQISGGPAGGVVSRAIGQQTGQGTVSVPMSASVTIAAIGLAVLLALLGGLLAGSFGGWRAARLRPVAALAKVA
jgi:putative ABC transport system permease protein